VELLASAKPLKNKAPVHFHVGAAETEAEVRYLDGRGALQPGESAWARVVLKEAALVFPGDRFIIRRFSPVITIGGGMVADISGHKYQKEEDAGARLSAITPERLVCESLWGVTRQQLIAWTGLKGFGPMPSVEAAGGWLIGHARIGELRGALVARCRKFHREHSLMAGIPKQDLKAAVMGAAAAEVFDYALNGAAELTQDGEVVRLKSHRVVLKQDEEQARAAIEGSFERAGLAAPAVADVLKASGVEAARARSLLQILLREGKLTRISDELVLHAAALARLREQLGGRRGERFSVPVFKDWTGVSRKYAIPLLEYLDREHVTRREGDERVLIG
jgi:selenocysteine-specific elongation factor